MKNNILLTYVQRKVRLYPLNTLLYKIIFCFTVLFLFLIGSIFNTRVIATAKTVDSPFYYENAWAKYNNYLVLNIMLHAKHGNYTYAPHQKGVYPTKFTLYLEASPQSIISHTTAQSSPLVNTPPLPPTSFVSTSHSPPLNSTSVDSPPQNTTQLNTFTQSNTLLKTATSHNTTQLNTIKNIPILFPIGIKKPDPLNKSVQVYVYEKNQNIFILFPSTFAPLNANLELSFLACSDVRCQPLKTNFKLSHTNNIQDAKDFPWFKEFEKRFIAMQNNDTTKVNIGLLNIDSKQQNNTISIAPANSSHSTKNPTYSSNSSYSLLNSGFNSVPTNPDHTTESPTPSSNDSPSRLNFESNLIPQNTAHSTENLSNNSDSDSINNSDTSSNTNLNQDLNHDFNIDALRASINNNASNGNNTSQKNNDRIFSPRPLNTSLEVYSLYKALLFGLIAGFILNFMPCVLPVIALKISAFLGGSQSDTARYESFRKHNLFFALGIITWFMVLGLLLGLAGLSWGQLFQNPLIVLGLLIFIFAMSLSLFGIFHLPILDLRIVHDNKKIKQNEKLQAFTSGLMATLLATPCSGPLLGSVLGYSLTQSIPILLTIFFSMGFGMALPYVFFAINPRLIRFMPRAGNWLNTMEQVLGFFLMATSIYLLSILPTGWHIKSLIILLLVALSAYIWGKWGSFHSSGLKKLFIALSCFALIAVPSSYLLQKKEQNILWENFTNENFDELLGKETLLLKFTADWCPTCKILEQTVFTKKNMENISNNYDIRFIYVDITEFNEEKQNLLKSLDSVSIPLLAVFPKGELAKSPIIIRDLYTLNQLEKAITLAEQ